VGRRHGVSEEQLRQLSVYQQSDAFSTVEKLVLEYAVEMTRMPVEVPDELFARLREYFDEQQMVELTAAIAWENYRARFNHAFGLESQGFAEGAYCALPAHPVESTQLGSHWKVSG
jgi:alkylhydroperoxidase family enzyme